VYPLGRRGNLLALPLRQGQNGPVQIPTNQFAEYRTSVHWEAMSKRGDLSAPSCASCHGNHGAKPPGRGIGSRGVRNVPCAVRSVFVRQERSPADFLGGGWRRGVHRVPLKPWDSSTLDRHAGLARMPVCSGCHDAEAPRPRPPRRWRVARRPRRAAETIRDRADARPRSPGWRSPKRRWA